MSRRTIKKYQPSTSLSCLSVSLVNFSSLAESWFLYSTILLISNLSGDGWPSSCSVVGTYLLILLLWRCLASCDFLGISKSSPHSSSSSTCSFRLRLLTGAGIVYKYSTFNSSANSQWINNTLKLVHRFKSLPNDKTLDWSKLKAFADNINVTVKLKFVLGRVENIVDKGENAGHQHFLLFPQCFQNASHTGSLKVVIVW